MRAVAIEAVRTLSQSPFPAVCCPEQSGGPRRADTLRAEAIVGLADDADHHRQALLALARASRPNCGVKPFADCARIALTEQEYSALRASSRDDVASLELADRLAFAKSRPRRRLSRPRPGRTLDAWLGLLEGPADPAAGERVFFHSKGPGCFRCHQVNGRGGRAGPDLSTLAAGMNRRRLVESILTPSKEIAPQFVAWSVARTNGTVFTGILLDQTPEGSLVFADSQGRLIAVKTDEIAERKPQTTSIMPDNLANA